ncbi:MAG TPA: cytochrome c biogenesis protein CcdA [Sedimentisphaerales bacterium]|nr:cytochrome c biogenesis protein CcdA [Sedimentisphaerales bacterium]
MEWIQSIMQWARTILEQTGFRPLALPLAFVLGLASAVASACCTLPVLGAIVGYSGTREDHDRRANLFDALFFMLGTTIALVILGFVAGFIGQVAQDVLGKYWKLFAGLIAIFVGLGALKLLPFKLPSRSAKDKSRPKGFLAAAAFGLVMGGGVSVASLACNPGVFIILGVAVLQGYTFWAMALMAAYAVGFSLPLALIMLGASLGKSAIKAKTTENAMRIIGGILLILAGFYFLATL